MFSREPPEHYKQNGDVSNFISERCFWQPIGSWKEAKVRVWKTGDLGRDSCGEERKWRQKDAREEFGEGRKKRDQRLKKLSGRWRRTLAGRQSGFGVDMMNLVTWARAGGGWSRGGLPGLDDWGAVWCHGELHVDIQAKSTDQTPRKLGAELAREPLLGASYRSKALARVPNTQRGLRQCSRGWTRGRIQVFHDMDEGNEV